MFMTSVAHSKINNFKTWIENSVPGASEKEDSLLCINNHETKHIAARHYVLMRCNQSETQPFDVSYPEQLLQNSFKVDEGSYSEIFSWLPPKDKKARIMKVMPIAGNESYNMTPQKDFHEIIAEIVISQELSGLRTHLSEIDRYQKDGKMEFDSNENATDVFNEVLAVKCVQGKYPSHLINLWNVYNETEGSYNTNPAMLPGDQEYVVFELADAGNDLQSYQFNAADQAYAVFLQVAFGLAVAEESFQFEHRDLHWGNIVVAPTGDRYANFLLRGVRRRVLRRGVAATIIDYSLSRATMPLCPHEPSKRVVLYNDLSEDVDLFGPVGLKQREIYRVMREKLRNDWKIFEPYTNVLWLQYILDKMITEINYRNKDTETHKEFINKLRGIKERILGYRSAAHFVLTDTKY
ncbi:hypothetical protein O0L34_g18585 [Tuta absoluta]|nr:hypothetical protein O0L34_g18585 [Tuta absoluta]